MAGRAVGVEVSTAVRRPRAPAPSSNADPSRSATEYGGLDRQWFFVGDASALSETSEIWVPDVELWNAQTSLATSFTDTYASVSPEGDVFWSRPGHLNPVCRFEGLHDFPFDRLSCKLELGSWYVPCTREPAHL